MPSIEANFEPGNRVSSAVVLERNNVAITLSLYKLVPFLVLSNRVLNTIVWTSNSNTRNFTIIIMISIVILHWGQYVLFILPTLVAMLTCCVIWILNKSVAPLDQSDLTLGQMFNSMINFNTICEFLFPIESQLEFNLWLMLYGSIVITPIYVYFIKEVSNVQVYLLTAFLGCSLWYSSLLVAARSILWRWRLIRRIANKFTSNRYQKFNDNRGDDNRYPENSTLSEALHHFLGYWVSELDIEITQLDTRSHVVQISILENERWWPLVGWTKHTLDGPRLCSKNKRFYWHSLRLAESHLERIFGDIQFRWLDADWDFSDTWKSATSEPWTRQRMLVRRGVAISGM